ncbi:MAG: hypothetical protein H7067_01690 [Burkholderiales bacterium]|nr:hypothetical protein [Opitutaceae bacterium]
MLDWLRLWPEFIRLNLRKDRHRRRQNVSIGQRWHSAPCQSASDSGRPGDTRCEACQILDRASRYRLVCPDLSVVAGEARCTRSAGQVRPYWGRAALAFLAPPALLYLVLTLGYWSLLRTQGITTVPLADALLPDRWENIAEHRRDHFHNIALRAFAAGDARAATIALFTAAQTGRGDPEQNRLLARLAYLSGFQSLGDDLHTAALAQAPAQAAALSIHWHDDLLLARRPTRLATLALEQLAHPDAPREFWLHAYFESLRHPDVPSSLDPALVSFPHPGLRDALLARQAVAAGDFLEAHVHLYALGQTPPGAATQAFLVESWLDIRDHARAFAAAADPRYAASPAQTARLRYLVHHHAGDLAAARREIAYAREDAATLSATVAILIHAPDAPSLALAWERVSASEPVSPTLLGACWLAARSADHAALVSTVEIRLAAFDPTLPSTLRGLAGPHATLAIPALATLLLPLDRDALYQLQAPPPLPPKPGL